MECSNYLFEDSKIAKKMACGRTKPELIIKEMLGPFFFLGMKLLKLLN